MSRIFDDHIVDFNRFELGDGPCEKVARIIQSHNLRPLAGLV